MNKTEAIDKVETGNAEWCYFVEMAYLASPPEKGSTITSDDLWRIANGQKYAPKEPRAMGAVMRFLQKYGCIKPLQKWQPSTRSCCHSRPVRIWRVL